MDDFFYKIYEIIDFSVTYLKKHSENANTYIDKQFRWILLVT